MDTIAAVRRGFPAALIAGLLLIAGGCGGGGSTAPAAEDPPPAVEAELTRGLDALPPLPRSGSIMVMDADSGNLRAVAEGAWPAWSPDGTRIAFHRDGEIRVIDVDSGAEALIGRGEYPAWSPDGTRFAFRSDAGISVVNIDGTDVVDLVAHEFRDDTYLPLDMGVSKPSWSADGERIAFEHLGDGTSQPATVFVMNADGSGVHRLADYGDGVGYAESDPSWSPDGTKIALWSYGHGVVTVDADGGAPAVVYENYPTVAYGARPSWSADSQSLAFGLFLDRGIVTVAVSGSGLTQLTSSGHEPAWSANGRIAFVDGVTCLNGWELTISNTGDPDTSGFYLGNTRVTELDVRVGVAVSWLNDSQVAPYTAQIVSTATPTGGASFDSETLDHGKSFTFFPEVEGTWEYEDRVTGMTARFTASKTTVPPEIQCN